MGTSVVDAVDDVSVAVPVEGGAKVVVAAAGQDGDVVDAHFSRAEG